MRRKACSEEQIPPGLRDAEMGTPAMQVYRKMGHPSNPFIAGGRRSTRGGGKSRSFDGFANWRKITVSCWGLWQTDYNEHSPNTSLGNKTPKQFETEWFLSSTAKGAIFKHRVGPKIAVGEGQL